MKTELLNASGVSVQFNALRALSEVSFSVRHGELLALIGPNGAGKTTLLNVLAGEVKPSAGHVTYDGQPTTHLQPHQIVALGLARTFQAAEPFQNLTVRENVMVGLVPQSAIGLLASLAGLGRRVVAGGHFKDDADAHLQTVGLASFADQPAAILTAGQRRLLSIARALATGAETLVLDEPGAGLNETEKTALGDVILKIHAAGRTIVFVDHDMPLVSRIAQRILVLDRGCLIADGKPDQVRSDPRVIDAYLGVRETRAVAKDVTKRSVERPLLLDVDRLDVSYAGLIALGGVSIKVREGEIVSLVGANGAGKSSLLRAIARVERGQAARLQFGDSDLRALRADQAVARGVSLVPEGRALFTSLTVAENLAAGRYARRRAEGFRHVLFQSSQEKAVFEERLALVYGLFPILKERSAQLAGTLSGGQGQMLAIGRALMGDPKLLMLDEPSLGLAPQVIEQIFESIQQLRQQGLSILLVEQNIGAALAIADHAYVLANGAIQAEGSGRELLDEANITQAYLGVSSGAEAPAARFAAGGAR
jgi:branched-chain amino acid transport system ATP-binding protein